MAAAFNLTAQLNLRGPSNIATIVADIRKQIGSINANVNFKLDPNAARNVSQLNSALTTFNSTLSQTSASANNAASALRNLSTAINGVRAQNLSQTLNATSTAATKASQAVSNTGKAISRVSSEMVEFGKQSGLAIRRFAAFSTVTGAVYGVANAIGQGISSYIEYDRQLVKLQQVTGQSAKGLQSLENAITSLSTAYGVGSMELTEVSSTLAQAGLSAKDTERALKALAMSALAPSFDSMNDTVEGSIALMRQFGIGAIDLEKALGSVNSVAARFAVEASDLITAIQRTGGVFATASKGVSEGTDALNEFLAVFTSVRATTRESAETIATGLRTIFTRIQREDTINALKEYGVNLTDLDGKFVGAFKAVELLSKGLSSLDPRDLKFSRIVEELGGFRQIGKVIPLIQQFATTQEALKVAQTGQGSLASDAAKAQESLAIQISKVRQEFLALFREIGQSDSFQTIIKGALSVTSALIKVADSVKGILPVLGVILAFRGASAITQFSSGFLQGVRGSGGARGFGQRIGGKNEGGEIRYFASGGLVPGSGDTDSVSAKLTPGEFVMRKSAVKNIGANNLQRMNRYAAGGIVYDQPIGKLERSHIGADIQLSKSEISNYFKSYNNKRFRNAIKERTNYSIEDIVSGNFNEQELAQKMKLKIKERVMINLPSSFNQALRVGNPDLVSQEALASYVAQSNNLFPIKVNNSDQIRTKLTNKIRQLRAKKYKRSDKPNILSFDTDNELDSLKSVIDSEGLQRNKLDIMYAPAIADASYRPKDPITGQRTGPLRIRKQSRTTAMRSRLRGFESENAQRFNIGGVVQRRVGYIDYDVIANPANEAIVKKGMEATGVTGPRLYADHLSQLAVIARKNSNLQKLRAVYGVAGSGKTTLARGQGTDNARLRNTERFPILSPEDIQKATEIIILSSSVSKDKLDNVFGVSDRTYTLSSTTKEEKDRVKSQRASRDSTGIGLEGRQPGVTSGVATDTAVGEALLSDRIGNRSVVLGRSDSGRLRRKKGNELVEMVKKKIGFTWGSFSPMTAGHESIMDAAAAMGISPEDFIYLVGSNEGIKAGNPSSYRTAVFDQDFRVALSKAGAGARGATILPKPRDFEVPQAFDISEQGSGLRKVLIPAKGSRAFVADKTSDQTQKYKDAGYEVSDIERMGGISGTMVRDLIMSGDTAQLQQVLSPRVYDIIAKNLSRLQNRANILPDIIEQVKKTQGVKLSEIEQEINAIGISRIDSKKVATDPEYAAKVQVLQELRDKRDKIKSAASFEPYRLLGELAQSQPDKYGLDLATSSTGASSGLMESIKQRVTEQLAVPKGSGNLPTDSKTISKSFFGMTVPSDSAYGSFAGKPLTPDIIKKVWRTSYDPIMSEEKKASYTALRELLEQKYNAISGARSEQLQQAITESKMFGLVGLLPIGHEGLSGPFTWNLGKNGAGEDVSITASILERGLGKQYDQVVKSMQERASKASEILASELGSASGSLTKTKPLSGQQLETLGQGNIEGAMIEQALARLGAKTDNISTRTRPIDFPDGLGEAAKLFPGIDPNMPTEVKRTINSDSRSKAIEEFQRYLRLIHGIPEETKAKEKAVAMAQGGLIQKFMAGGAATLKKPKEVFGTGETAFPKRISNAYAKEKQKDEETLRAKLAWDEYPNNERIMVDESKAQEAYQQPFDRAKFLESFKQKITRNSLFARMADFAKFIGLPQENLSTVLPLQLDFGGPGMGLWSSAQFQTGARGTRDYEGLDLSQFGYGEKQKQELYGLNKLIEEKKKNIAKIRKTPIGQPYSDGSYRYDEEAYNKANEELSSLRNKQYQLEDLKKKAQKQALEERNNLSKSSGRGTVSFAAPVGYAQGTQNNVMYHELTHQLLEGLRARSQESFSKYKDKVTSLFSGDNNDLADAFDALTQDGGYSSADVVYGRSYKLSALKSMLSNYYRQSASFDAKKEPVPEDITKNLASLSGKGDAAKRAREFRPINPSVNQALLTGKYAVSQAVVDKMEDNGKEEFLTTLMQKAPALDQNLQDVLDSTLSDLLSSAGIQRQRYSKGGMASKKFGSEIYDLQKGTGLSDREFDLITQYAKTNDFSVDEFKQYLSTRLQQKAQKSQLMTNPRSLQQFLLHGTRAPTSTDKQKSLAQSLMGEPDPGYRPMRRYAYGGTVSALVSNGEAYIPPETAKRIGYSTLHKMNQADRNGMSKFAGGGISVFKGPGSGTSDSIGPIDLPVGSFILREKATKALGLYAGGGVGIQAFADGGGLSARPESISSSTVAFDNTARQGLEQLIEILKQVGVTASRSAVLLSSSSAASYKAAETAAKADLERAKAAGASIDQIISAEKALRQIREAKNTDIGKRNILESTFSSASGLSSGQAQQKILSTANTNAERQIKTREASRLAAATTEQEKQEKDLLNRKRLEAQSQIKSSLEAQAIALNKGAPLTNAQQAKINLESRKRAVATVTDISADDRAAIKANTIDKARLSDDKRKEIYEKATIKATSSITGVSKSDLAKSGIGANDIRQYVQQSMMDRKTLAQMDKQLIASKTEELKNSIAYKNASSSEQKRMLAELRTVTNQELQARRQMANDMARAQGVVGPGGAGLLGSIGYGLMSFGSGVKNRANSFRTDFLGLDMVGGQSQFVGSTKYRGLTGAAGNTLGWLASGANKIAGPNSFMTSMALGMLAGQGENVASFLGGKKRDRVGNAAAFEAGVGTFSAGLALTGQAAMISGPFAPIVAGVGLAATALASWRSGVDASTKAIKEYEENLKTQKAEEASVALARALEDLSKNVDNIDLQKSLNDMLKESLSANNATSSRIFDEKKSELRADKIGKMSTMAWIGSFVTGVPESTSKDLSASDYKELARKQIPRYEEDKKAAIFQAELAFKQGKSIDDIKIDDAFKPLREALARTDLSILPRLLELDMKEAEAREKASKAVTDAEKQQYNQIANNIAAQRQEVIDESTASNQTLIGVKKTAELNRAMEEAAKAAREVSQTFGSMARLFDQAVNRVSFNLDNISDASNNTVESLTGTSKIGSVRSQDAIVLANPSAYTDKEVQETSKRVARGMFDPNAIGISPEEKAKREKRASEVEQVLQINTETIAKKVSAAAGKVSATSDIEEISGAMRSQLTEEIKGLPEQVQNDFIQSFNNIIQEVKNNDKLATPEAKRAKLIELTQDQLAKASSDAAQKIKDMGVKYADTATKSLNGFIDATNRATQAQLRSLEFNNKAQDIRTDSGIALRELISGAPIGLAERANILNDRVSRLTGGITDPVKIRENIQNKTEKLNQKQAALKEELNTATSEQDKENISAKYGQEMSSLTEEINRNQQALDTFANSTELATAAMNQLQNLQKMQADRLQNIDQILTSTPQELRKFNESLVRIQQRAMGINPSPSREARRAYNRAFRQSGGNRRAATMAAQEQLAQDRAMDLRTMEQYRSTFILSQMNANPGMTQEAANNLFNQNAANARGQMAFESGAVNMYGPGLLQGIMAGANPMVDPAFARTAGIYKDASEKQAKANEQKAILETVSSLMLFKLATDTLTEGFRKLATIFNDIQNKLEDSGIKVVKDGKPVEAEAKASGGMIYANLGQLIDFKPQGTDTVPAMLTPGEFVVNAKATAQHLPLLQAINSGSDAIVSKVMSKGGIVYLAKGGKLKKDDTIEQDRAALDAEIQSQGESYTAGNEESQRDQAELAQRGQELHDAKLTAYVSDGIAGGSASYFAMFQGTNSSRWQSMSPAEQRAEIERYQKLIDQKREAMNQRISEAENRSTGMGVPQRAEILKQIQEEDKKKRQQAQEEYNKTSSRIEERTSRNFNWASLGTENSDEKTGKNTGTYRYRTADQQARYDELDRRKQLEEARQIAYGEKEPYTSDKGRLLIRNGQSEIVPWKPGEREAYIKERQDQAREIVNKEEKRQGLPLTDASSAPAGEAATQAKNQAEVARAQSEARAQENKANQQSSNDPFQQAQQVIASQAEIAQGIASGRALAIQTGQFDPGKGSSQERRLAARMGLTVQEMKYIEQQQKLSRMKPQDRDREIARLKAKDRLVAPSSMIAEQEKLAVMQQAMGQAAQYKAFEERMSAIGQAGRQEYQSVGGQMPAITSADIAQSILNMQNQDAVAMSQARTESVGRSAESANSDNRPLSRAEGNRLSVLLNTSELERNPEEQDEYLALSYRAQSTKGRISPYETFEQYKTRETEKQYHRWDKRYNEIQERTAEGTAPKEDDEFFLGKYKAQQTARQQAVDELIARTEVSARTSVTSLEATAKANDEARSRYIEYQNSDQYKADQQSIADIELRRQQAQYRQFVATMAEEAHKQKMDVSKVDPAQLAQYWAGLGGIPGLDQIKDSQDRERLVLSFEKQASDYLKQFSQDLANNKPIIGGLPADELEQLRKDNPGVTDPISLINIKYRRQIEAQDQAIGYRLSRELPTLDRATQATSSADVMRQAQVYRQAAVALSKIQTMDSETRDAKMKAYEAEASALETKARNFAVIDSMVQADATAIGGTQINNEQVATLAQAAAVANARSDTSIDTYDRNKKAEEARIAIEHAREQARVEAMAQEQERVRIRMEAQQTAAAAAEKERQQSMWVNSSNPIIATAGWLGGVGESGVRAVRGGTTAVIGAGMNAASQTGVVDYLTGSYGYAARGQELDAQAKAIQARLGSSLLGMTVAEAQATVDAKAAEQTTAAGDAFRAVANDAVVAGARDVANIVNAVTAGNAEQFLNQYGGGELGTNIFGRYGDDSAVAQMHARNAQNLRDIGMGGYAALTDFANSANNVAFNLLPIVTSFSPTTGTSVAARFGRFVGTADNVLSSPGSFVSAGRRILGAADNVLLGGRGARAATAATKPLIRAGKRVSDAYEFARPTLAAIGDKMPTFKAAARGIAGIATGTRIVGEGIMEGLNLIWSKTKGATFSGARLATRPFTSAASYVGRAASIAANRASSYAGRAVNRAGASFVDSLSGSRRSRRATQILGDDATNLAKYKTIAERSRKARQLRATRAATFDQRIADRQALDAILEKPDLATRNRISAVDDSLARAEARSMVRSLEKDAEYRMSFEDRVKAYREAGRPVPESVINRYRQMQASRAIRESETYLGRRFTGAERRAIATRDYGVDFGRYDDLARRSNARSTIRSKMIIDQANSRKAFQTVQDTEDIFGVSLSRQDIDDIYRQAGASGEIFDQAAQNRIYRQYGAKPRQSRLDLQFVNRQAGELGPNTGAYSTFTTVGRSPSSRRVRNFTEASADGFLEQRRLQRSIDNGGELTPDQIAFNSEIDKALAVKTPVTLASPKAIDDYVSDAVASARKAAIEQYQASYLAAKNMGDERRAKQILRQAQRQSGSQIVKDTRSIVRDKYINTYRTASDADKPGILKKAKAESARLLGQNRIINLETGLKYGAVPPKAPPPPDVPSNVALTPATPREDAIIRAIENNQPSTLEQVREAVSPSTTTQNQSGSTREILRISIPASPSASVTEGGRLISVDDAVRLDKLNSAEGRAALEAAAREPNRSVARSLPTRPASRPTATAPVKPPSPAIPPRPVGVATNTNLPAVKPSFVMDSSEVKKHLQGPMALPTGRANEYRYNPGLHSQNEHGITGWKASFKASGSTPEEVIANNKAIEQWLMTNHKAEFKPYADDGGLFWRAETMGGSAKEMEEFSALVSRDLGNILDTSFKYQDDPTSQVLAREFAPGIRARFDTMQAGIPGQNVQKAFLESQQGKLPQGVSWPWHKKDFAKITGSDQAISGSWGNKIEVIRDKLRNTTDPAEAARLQKALEDEEQRLSDILGKTFPGTYMNKGGIVYASSGTLVPQASPLGKDVADISTIENNEKFFTNYSDRLPVNNINPKLEASTYSSKIYGSSQQQTTKLPDATNRSESTKKSSPYSSKNEKDVKGIEFGENLVAKINNAYPEMKDAFSSGIEKLISTVGTGSGKASNQDKEIIASAKSLTNIIKEVSKENTLVDFISKNVFDKQQQPKPVTPSVRTPQQYATGGIVYANNGVLVSAQSRGTDTVPAMLTSGEFVVNRDQAQKHMPVLQAINSGHYSQGGIVQYLADGGIVAPKYYGVGGAASGIMGMASSTFKGAAATAANLDMAAVTELAKTINSLKDSFGSLENVKELGQNMQQFMNGMSQNVAAFGESIATIPQQVMHNMQATVTQHVTGINGAEHRYQQQFDGKMDQVARHHTSQIVDNLHKSSEGAITNGDKSGIIGRQGGIA